MTPAHDIQLLFWAHPDGSTLSPRSPTRILFSERF